MDGNSEICDTIVNMEDTQALAYVSGYILKKIVYTDCPQCKINLFSETATSHHLLVSIRERSELVEDTHGRAVALTGIVDDTIATPIRVIDELNLYYKPPPQPTYDPVFFVDQMSMDSSVAPVIINEHPSILSSSVDMSAQNCGDVFENAEEVHIALNNLMDNFEKNIQAKEFYGIIPIEQETMRELINMLEPHLAGGTRGHKISKEQRILAAVRFFASGSYQRWVGQDCFINLSQSQISLAITEVATGIETHLHGFVNFPGQEEYPGIKATIMERFNVPGVIGFVDVTHIAITKPKVDVKHQYLNRKGYHSKNVQIMCGPNNTIFSINATHDGASHDAFIWRNSHINDVLHQRFIRSDRLPFITIHRQPN
ncbi:hypothetical protein Zmor_014993 [Zophobas morio]|uniref:DDE Tnp4 domain-containing protein n=1 Tax=Zophobas morio TaxID=2755281 RepID=A0AA38MHH9_9CUCU|nr:hypothetical protein Zmor_014993 [Zophobas morio]